ncbi:MULTISPECIES: hypothetical protein [Peribacillus]|uniref:hypothetical protein n=1 Tax=Peribacillus TaxID=2675229 RepID=UPI00333BC6E4
MNNHFEKTLNSLLVDLSQTITEYNPNDLRIATASFMKFVSKMDRSTYNSSYYFDAKKVQHIKNFILSYYQMK